MLFLASTAYDPWAAEGMLRQSPSPRSTLIQIITSDDGKLSAHIPRSTLGAVLAALRTETGVVFEVADPRILSREVSVQFEDADLSTVIRFLLEDYSYMSGPVSGGAARRVRILATGQQWREGDRYAGLRAPRRDDSAADEEDSADKSEGDLVSAWESLRSAETDTERHDALERLVDTKSPEATPILIEQALGEGSGELRAGAVDALWRHAADGQFSDPAVIAVLRRLTTDDDATVRAIAVKSLADMERYLASNSPPVASTP